MPQKRQIKADLAIIGAGSGGLSTAAGAAQLGLKVVLFEKGEMGGDCLNYGCVPSKALIAAAKRAHAIRHSAAFGVRSSEPEITWTSVRSHVKSVIAAIAPVDSQERFEGLGCTVIREHARFKDARTIVSDSVEVRAKRMIISTGSSAFVPSLPGLETVPYLTNETVFDLDVLPRRLVVLGAGPIGVELGQAFRRLGSEVVLVEAAQPLARADSDAAALALEQLKLDGVILESGQKAVAVRKTDQGLSVTLEATDGARRDIEGSHLLVALGRRAHVTGLDLEHAGVAYDSKGVKTKPNLRTANPRIWALGDVAGREQFTHVAGQHAKLFVQGALFKTKASAEAVPIPSVTYCDPEVAQIGYTEKDARAHFGDKAISVSRWTFEHNDRAQAEGHTNGFGKLIVGKGGKILGASIVGEGAGDLIQIVAVAMANGLGVRALTNYIAPYPTRGELVKRLAGQYYTPALFAPRTKTLVKILSQIP